MMKYNQTMFMVRLAVGRTVALSIVHVKVSPRSTFIGNLARRVMYHARFRTVTGTSLPLTASTTQQRTPLNWKG